MFGVALTLQITVVAAMGLVVHPAIALLIILRMVPGALTQPFLLEAIQPRLESAYRATYLSLQSLIARLVFTGTLVALATAATGSDTIDRDALTTVLPWCAAIGAVCAAALLARWPNEREQAAQPAKSRETERG